LPHAAVPTRKITKAEVIPWENGYGVAFKFDDGTAWSQGVWSKRVAEFYTTDRIGDAVPIGGSPLLLPGSKHPARW
jgi:hypothetical protein